MDTDSATNAVRQEQLSTEEIDDTCIFEHFGIAPLTTDTDGSCPTECVSGDWPAEVRQEDLIVVKHEPHDDDESSGMCSVSNDAVPAEVDETHSHMKHVFMWETLDSAWLQSNYRIRINTGSSGDFQSGADSTGESEIKTEADTEHTTEHLHDDKPTSDLCTSKEFMQTVRRRVQWNSRTGDSVYSCTQCEKRFSSLNALSGHMNIHAGKHKCSECGRCCPTSSELERHRRCHSAEKPFECALCSKRFTLSASLVRHSRIHSGQKPYRCHVCDKAFSESRDLNTHVRVHTGEKPHRCSECDKSFGDFSSLYRHKRCVHSDSKRLECPHCGKLFKIKQELKRHVRIHTDAKPYSCRHCSDCFTWDHQLKRHLLKSHNEGTWFTCFVCQKKFGGKQELERHIPRHEDATVKPYVCSECPKRFYTRHELRRHHPVHS